MTAFPIFDDVKTTLLHWQKALDGLSLQQNFNGNIELRGLTGGDGLRYAASDGLWKNFPGDYSETEQALGYRWINGGQLYRLVVDVGAMPNATLKTVAHGIPAVDDFITIRGWAYNGSTHLPIPYVDEAGNNHLQLSANATNIFIDSDFNYSSWDEGYVILEYTRTET
jgi:hypothetical protein